MRVLAVSNQKGGVGKTTTTINLAGSLVEQGARVLLVDLDPQGHLTSALGVAEGTEPATLPNALLRRFNGTVGELLVLYRDEIAVLPTHPEMFRVETHLHAMTGGHLRLARVLESMADVFDVALIDCPPSLGLLTDNALIAASREHVPDEDADGSGLIIPVQSEDSSVRALELLFAQVDSIADALRITIKTQGLVINGYDGRRGKVTTTAGDALIGLGLPVLAVVKDRAKVREAWRFGKPVAELAPESEEAGWYRRLAKLAPMTEGELKEAMGRERVEA